ncbi:MAG: hypothetical protein K0Q87_224 [Neobacillus sp.]|nr:hypothetical protein [Neobacillus sp.]
MSEISKVVIVERNSQVKEYRSDLIITEDKFISNQVEETESGIQPLAINKKKFDWEFTCWGLQVY